MLCSIIRNISLCAGRQIKQTNIIFNRYFHEEFTNPSALHKQRLKNPKTDEVKIKSPPPAFATKFQVFKDENAPIIFDIEEENLKLQEQMEVDNLSNDLYEGLNLERGKSGVFDIEDLVEALKREKAENIFVCSVPKELKYVDYVCIVNGFNIRHRKALAQFIRKLFKLKRYSNDILPKIEGETCQEWIALDLGNIALHIFSPEGRQKYKLEPLWVVGSKYDDESNMSDDHIVDLYERHTIFLGDLTPKVNS